MLLTADLSQPLVYEGNGHRPLSDRSRTALGGCSGSARDTTGQRSTKVLTDLNRNWSGEKHDRGIPGAGGFLFGFAEGFA